MFVLMQHRNVELIWAI